MFGGMENSVKHTHTHTHTHTLTTAAPPTPLLKKHKGSKKSGIYKRCYPFFNYQLPITNYELRTGTSAASLRLVALHFFFMATSRRLAARMGGSSPQ